jgi:hypothetical protein
MTRFLFPRAAHAVAHWHHCGVVQSRIGPSPDKDPESVALLPPAISEMRPRVAHFRCAKAMTPYSDSKAMAHATYAAM